MRDEKALCGCRQLWNVRLKGREIDGSLIVNEQRRRPSYTAKRPPWLSFRFQPWLLAKGND